MKARLFTALASLFLVLPLGAQGKTTGHNNPGHTGGTNHGPGDTVPGAPNPGDGGGPEVPPPSNQPPPVPTTPGYAPGADPRAPRIPPGEAFPGSPTESAPAPTPTSPPRTETLNSWQTWWHYNRWAHLEVDGSLLARTGTGGFFLGNGDKADSAPQLRATEVQIRDVVQPALTRALERGGQSDFVIFTLHALAKLRDVPLLKGQADFGTVVQIFLKSANQSVSEKAVLALGIRGEDRFLPWLVAILSDTSQGRELVGRSLVGERMRAFAALRARTARRAYSRSGGARRGLRRADGRTARRARGSAVRVPPGSRHRADAERRQLRRGRRPLPRQDAPRPGADDPRLLRGRNAVLPGPAPRRPTRSRGCWTEHPNRCASAWRTPLLVASGPLTQELREIQNAAIIALGNIGRSGKDPLDQEIRQHLERVAYKSSADRSTRYLAMVAMASAATRRGDGEDPFTGLGETRRTFQRYMRSRGETLAWTALALGILEEDAMSRGEAADPDSAECIREALEKARSSEVAGALAIALGMIRDPEAIEVLLARLKETGDPYMRGYAALALGMIGSPAAIAPIRQVLSESTDLYFVVENAAIALALLGDQETGVRMYDVLDKASNPKVQASVASAMGWIRDPRALDKLCTALGDMRRNDTARAWTAVAIGRICDRDRWPWVGRLSVDALYDVNLPTLLEPIYETGLLDLP
jgi:HEAT repeat protein